MEKFTYLKSSNADYIDELFTRYQANPESIDPSWRYFFDGLELGAEAEPVAAPDGRAAAVTAPSTAELLGELRVAELIQAYREFGKLAADINPLRPAAESHELLQLSRFGLSDADLPKTFQAGKWVGLGPARLSDIIAKLRETYCRKIAVEFAHMSEPAERAWLQEKMEASRNHEALDAGTKEFILKRLTESESFERFLHTRYVAQKRFSVEGGESVIPALDCAIETGAGLGAEQFVLGMAHRGRLNVLVNLFDKKPEYIFTEFEGAYKPDPTLGEGDVKYHMGHSRDFTTRNGKNVHLSMASNPSHLEFVNAVVEGIARAKQDHLKDESRTKVIPVLIHGDAAFAGQGVCFETLQMSQIEGYKTGGTLHIVINNQVGFTTPPEDSRSTRYSTDLAKTLSAPIFHVNGDSPEAVWYISKLAMEYRQKFKKDVFIDLVCYRKHGHNEGDEPTFTQPLMYKAIKAHASTRELYTNQLASEGVLNGEKAQQLIDQTMARFTEAQQKAKAEAPKPYVSAFEGRWSKYRRPSESDLFTRIETAVPAKKLVELSEKLNAIPAEFHLHSKLTRFFETRLKAVQDGKGIDWGNGESLAFATLLDEGHPIRLSGQDAERGTFTHRHSVLTDFENAKRYTPLNHLRAGQAQYEVRNSLLSEMAVMGFEYGYSLADPDTLTIWEAQFGDFANGAQVIIDQFLSSSESKWQRMTGLVLLLPHGFEGQGPEHSSARLERFLQLCGRNNMFVCNFTTPAQLFHALRRQVKRDFRKPMVVMSPKSLLRHPMAVSTIDDFAKGSYQEVLDDVELDPKAKAAAKKVVLCTGKVYYDLVAERTARKSNDVAIVRVEQLYPFPAAKLADTLAQYKSAKSYAWAQEEPRNMGAWTYFFGQWAGGYDTFMDKVGGKPISYVGRDVGAAPAVGSSKLHEKEQRALVEAALTVSAK